MSNVGALGPILCIQGHENRFLAMSIDFVVVIILRRSLQNSAEEAKGKEYRDYKSHKKQRDKNILGSNPKKF